MKLTPKQWQKDAFAKWIANDKKGIISAATGTGKTYVGKMVLYYLIEQQKTDDNIYIVVPTIHLQKQWSKKIKETLGYNYTFVGGGHKTDYKEKIRICVVNSIRKHKLDGHCILDEVHHYGSKKNIRFLRKSNFKTILGLSATPKRRDNNEVIKLVPIIYKYNVEKAVKDGILSRFDIINIGVDLTTFEQTQYEKYNHFIKQHFYDFGYNFNAVKNAIGPSPRGMIAANLLRTFTKRKKLLVNSNARINKTIEIIKNNQQSKIIVFCELIKTANRLSYLLEKDNIQTAIYHSGLSSQERKSMLSSFKENESNIMLAVKALDEGIDVPECDVGIIVAGTSVKRQMIQRLGRILRKGKNKKSKLFQLYIQNTKDEEWMKRRSEKLYDIAENVFWQ